MITVIQILGDTNLSGAPQHVLTLAKGLDPKVFETVIIGPDGPIMTEFRQAEIKTITIPFSSKWQFLTIGRLRQAIRQVEQNQGKTDQIIIHCHGVRAGLFGRLAAGSFPYPVTYTEHSWTSDYHLPNPLNEIIQKQLLRYLDSYTSLTIGVSQAVVDFLIKEKISHADHIRCIHNGVAIPKTQLPINSKLRLGSVGSLTWQKNYSYLLEIIGRVQKELPEIELEIIGEGPERAKLESLIEQQGLSKQVRLIGSIPHQKLSDHYKDWSLYLQPSTNESFGLALAEAVAAGLPALGTATGSIPEILHDKAATFPLNDSKVAAKLIIHYLTNKKARADLWANEFKSVSRFTPERMVEAHQRLYCDLCHQVIS